MSQTKERSLSERIRVATRELGAYSRLSARYHDPHYLTTGLGEVARDFIAGKDTMLEEATSQLREFRADQQLMKATEDSPFIQ